MAMSCIKDCAQSCDLRMVLLGKTGAGKSATGNTILGRPGAFQAKLSKNSVTKECEKKSGEVAGRTIDVIDTPGIGDELLSEQEVEGVKSELARCVELSFPGPHAFLLVISLNGRNSQEERDCVCWIQGNFGDEAAGFTILLFTHGDKLEEEQPVEGFILENEYLRDLVNSCGGRYHVLDNKARGNTTQVPELLEKIEMMVQENEGQHYTNDMYKKAQGKIIRERNNILINASIVTGGAALGAGVVAAANEGQHYTNDMYQRAQEEQRNRKLEACNCTTVEAPTLDGAEVRLPQEEGASWALSKCEYFRTTQEPFMADSKALILAIADCAVHYVSRYGKIVFAVLVFYSALEAPWDGHLSSVKKSV